MISAQSAKKKNVYTEEVLKKALDDVRENKKSIRQICKDYGIPKTTILDKISGRRPDGIKKPGPEPVLGVDGEKKIIEWLVNISKCGFPVKRNELLDTVQKIIRDGDFKNRFKDDRPGQKWFDKFLARNKEVSLKNAEGINKARALVTEESIRLWFKELEEYLSSIQQKDILTDPERIFNGDESGFALCPKTGKVLGPRGYKNLYQIKPSNEKENITVLLTFNANGDSCPPCVVFPYVRPPKAVVDSMPKEWCLGKSESGWMRGDVFFEYVTNEFNNWVEQNNIKKPVLLLVDGHKSHMSLMLSTICEEMQIILYALPPNTTHILQPADVSVFAPVKTYWKDTVREFLSKPENINSAVTKTNFCTLLNETLKHPNMPENIKNGFKRCGLYPFNADSPDYTKCVRNTLENVQPAEELTQNINHFDIKSFKRVLKHLKPVLKEKKINVRTILKEVNALKKSLPAELGIGEISIETGSESSLIDLSNTKQNDTHSTCINFDLDATTEISITSTHDEDKDRNSSPTLQLETVSAQIHTASKPSAKPATSKLNKRNIAPVSIINFDEITVYRELSQNDYVAHGCNKNNSHTEDLPIIGADETVDTISTLHVSGLTGSYLEVGSMVSLDDILILPLSEDVATPTTVPNLLTKEQTPESPMTSASAVSTISPQPQTEKNVSIDDILIIPLPEDLVTPTTVPNLLTKEQTPESSMTSASAVSPISPSQASTEKNASFATSISLTEKPFELQPSTSTVVRDLPLKNISNPFKNHLMLPGIPDKARRTSQRTPAAISSAAWRKYYDDKEEIKNKKQETIRKRKLERIEKQEQKKKLKETQKARKAGPKRKKKTNITPDHSPNTPDTVMLDLESQKENLPAGDATKCAECDDILISDVEDDDDKNIGCDKCVRWFHLKCTPFAGLSYLVVKDKSFECNVCDSN